ncbi:MAG: SWIM zinc finger family protein [Lachnospiraceae bacterium]|jgi:uncharacterized Zn finger protein
MSTYWKTGNFEQPTDEELKKNQAASRKREAMRGHVLEPVVVTNARGDICTSWWGKAWCRNLESYADYSNRLERGKRYLREGSVIDLKIARGKVTAKVQGSRKTPYRVEIRISPLSEEKIDAIMQQCGHKLDSLEKLTTGELPEDMRELFLGQNGLFPSQREISFSCSCPDWALMCKHVAAALYGVGVRLDEKPLLFFELRGIDPDQFVKVTIQNRVETMLENEDRPSERIMDDADLGSLFGVL